MTVLRSSNATVLLRDLIMNTLESHPTNEEMHVAVDEMSRGYVDEYSIRHGEDQVLSDRKYRGANPQFMWNDKTKSYFKVKAGIPWVRV